MKNTYINILRSIGFVAIGLFACHQSLAQQPVIREVNKTQGSMGEVVTLKGNYFGTIDTNLAVFFGATKGNIQLVTDQLLEVSIPAGTTYNTISVTNLTTGLTGYSRPPFLLSFGGAPGFDPTSLQGQFDFAAESGLYDICMCDFDGDKRVDMAATNDNSTFLDVMPNTSIAVGTVSFAKTQIALGTKSLHVTCGDINGDGKPDMVASESGTGDRIFVFQNSSVGSGSFAFIRTEIKLTGKKPKRIEIADLDLDGKPELIISDTKINDIIILENQSTLATIAFDPTPLIITIPGAASTDGLAVNDLNGDLKPEIVTSQFITGTSNLYIIQNKSTPGNFVLGDIITKSISGSVINIRIGDLDFDSKPDIAVTQLLSSAISIFLNQSTATQILFATPVAVLTEERPWGLDFGDLDGDGKTDVVVASVTKKNLTFLNNTSSPGSLSFTKTLAATTFINRHTKMGDVDGDGKPDIAFTSIDDNANSIPASKVSVFRNSTCMIPEVTPAGPLTVCSGFPLQLLATNSKGTTYTWKNGVTTVKSGPDPFLDVIATGVYTVTADAEGGNCSEPSNPVTVTVAGVGATSAVATYLPVCISNTLTLNVTNVGATSYSWTGPANFLGSGLSPTLSNFQLINEGRYYVDIIVGSCLAQQTSILVESSDVPAINVSPGSEVICQGATELLSASPTPPGFTYQWFLNSTAISLATSPTYTASVSGDYFVRATPPSGGCAPVNSNTVKITVVTKPVVNFNAPNTACAGQNVQYSDLSTTDTQVDATYLWDFGDNTTSTDKSPIHNFATANTYAVNLTVSYNGGCPVSKSQGIVITAAPAVAITNPDNKYKLCRGESLTLEVLGSFSPIVWSTGATSPSISVTEAATYSVDVTASNGCLLTATKIITSFDAPDLTISATPNQINEGETSQLVASGLNTYTWTPAETLSDPTLPNPVAKPEVTTVYTVTGSDANCTYETTVEVQVTGEAIVSKLGPSNFFSPNADGNNDTWMVEKINQYPQCSITIYDDKGVKVFEAKPYLDNWDGTFKGNGKPLPDGVYQYIIRCDGEENKPRKGSITILR